MGKCCIRKWILLLAVWMVWESAGLRAFALDVPDVEKRGSISVTMQEEKTKQKVPGGSFTLWKAADIQVEDGNYSWKFCEDFRDCGLSLENIESDELAQKLFEYAKDKKTAGIAQNIDEQGKVSFTDLKPGLYLMAQEKAAKGYEKVRPFLVSVPMKENQQWVYEINANPKMENVQKEDTHKSDNGESQKGTTTDSKLPQTGQLNWPIPILAMTGLILFLTGWILRFGKRMDGQCEET